MNRRKFLQSGSAAGLALTAGALLSFTEDNKAALKDDFKLNEATIADLQKQMQSGKRPSAELTKLYLKRIRDIDRSGPKLNAVIELNPDAQAIAKQMDAERKAGKIRGPLHGVPVLIKDNIDTGDRMMTTAGSLALVGNIASNDAFIIKQLRAAGAVLLGKTNLSEWANFRSTHSCSGWSSRGGQTKNAVMPNRNPSGSSSGSAAAVAANLCTVAIGTETDGSIVSPASVNGIVGIKPTVGLLSRTGIIPISSTQDTAGPMARTVTDAAILLTALTGTDKSDAATIMQPAPQRNYTTALDANSLRGKRIGIEKSFLTGNEAVTALYRQAIELMKNLGAMIIEVELLKNTASLNAPEFSILQYEFRAGVDAYLSQSNAKVRSLADVIEFNKKNERVAMPFFKQEILENSQAIGSLNDKKYKDDQKASSASAQIIDRLINAEKLDAICGVTNGPAWCIDIVNGDYDTGFSFSSPAAMSGYPHITVPMGTAHGLPVGLSFMSRPYHEEDIISFAYAYEQASKKRTAPTFLDEPVV